ncbi:hypothetical protein DSL72_008102 [Monilinia vaccinii-corymbosi]|uniref:Uncharacterized protein n=1 Tax=Monilinia vaccinii-corymbosi TaxID=61207 RepID=A0A8A3PJP4_9HELO|nr:hypothetical protein DSL72_008102 [Monilinia vaccinii-corymbosi]
MANQPPVTEVKSIVFSDNNDVQDRLGKENIEMINEAEEFNLGYLKALFLTHPETPIVTTALISITNDLHSFGQDNCIMLAYMHGYVSILIVWAKLSDGESPSLWRLLILMTPHSVADARDQSMALACITKLRIMDRALALSIPTAAYKAYLIQSLSPEAQENVREVFSRGHNLQFRILIAFAAAQIPIFVPLWQKK